jgi:hypothetical protein
LPAAEWDHVGLAAQARRDITEIGPLLASVLDDSLITSLAGEVEAGPTRSDDELWARIVYAMGAAAHRGTTSLEHLAAMFVPVYLWRASAFMAETAAEPDAAVQDRLSALCRTFERLKPHLVAGWSTEV